MIDIYIPPSQIIDTVNIYHLPHRQRKLSLRFLAWAVLHSTIQEDTHDSIEDARTALQLYEENNRLEAEGSWDEVLEEVYREGKRTVSFSCCRLLVRGAN
jgi:PAB-dependent poly(A)-specific ribonuclease subunit 2